MYNIFDDIKKDVKKPRGRPKKYKKNITIHYTDISAYLTECLEGFSKERVEMRELIMKVILLPRRHYFDDDAYSISKNFIRRLGHSYELFTKMNKKYGLYEVDNRYEIGVYSKRMFPTERLNAILEGMNNWEGGSSMKKSTKTLVEDYPTESSTSNDVTTVNGLSFYSSIKVDYSKLGEYIDSLPLDSIERMNALRWKAMCDAANLHDGMIPQTYHPIECGRLVGTGLTLQSVSSDMKQVLLDGHYNYDFVNCHYSIINNLGDYPTIKHYVENTQEHREILSDFIGVTITDIKKCLIALIYGVRRGNNKFSTITKILGAERCEAFWNSHFIKNLKKDCDDAVKWVTGSKDYKAFARFLMSVESSLLVACCEDVVIDVAMYDGFICKDDLDVKELEKKIYNKTKLHIKVKKEKIISPL